MTILLPSRQIIQQGRQFEFNANCWEADGLVGWWPLGSYPDSRDMSLHGNHGTPVGGPVQSTGGERFGMEFDGVDDYVDVGNKASLSFGEGDFTISIWNKADISNPSSGLVTKVSGGYWSGVGYSITLPSTPLIPYFRVVGDASATEVSFGSIYSPYDWKNLVAVRNGNTFSTYRDGLNISNRTVAAGNINNASSLFIGKGNISEYAGFLDDIRIYNRALSPGEVSELYRTTQPGGTYGRLAKPRVKYWLMGTTGNWSWLHHLQNSPYGISQ